MTKKGSSEILADESQEIFREKLKFFRKSENFSEIGGKSETEGKCIMVSGRMNAPDDNNLFKTVLLVIFYSVLRRDSG